MPKVPLPGDSRGFGSLCHVKTRQPRSVSVTVIPSQTGSCHLSEPKSGCRESRDGSSPLNSQRERETLGKLSPRGEQSGARSPPGVAPSCGPGPKEPRAAGILRLFSVIFQLSAPGGLRMPTLCPARDGLGPWKVPPVCVNDESLQLPALPHLFHGAALG